MGTRNLTCVFVDGSYRVAQYGQWDGYPSGQGLTALNFVRDKMDKELFITNIMRSRFIGENEQVLLWAKIGIDIKARDGFVSMEESALFEKHYPQLHRNCAAKVLDMIQDSQGLLLGDQIDFAADSLMCEYAYVIDLDANTFEVFKGFNHEPLNPEDRFYGLEQACADYFPVKMLCQWFLNDLPSDVEFIQRCEEAEGIESEED